MATCFAFKNAAFWLTGPLEIRLNHLTNIILLSHMYNLNFKIVWDTKSLPLNLEDITHAELLFGKVVDDFEFVKTQNYFYNPSLSIKNILTSTIANGLEANFPDMNITCCDWLIVDNLSMVRNDIIPDGILKISEFNTKCKQVYALLHPSATVSGQTSLFEKMQSTSTIVGVYVSKSDDIEDYLNYLKPFEYHYFFVFSSDFERDERLSVESTIRNTMDESKCMFIMQESYKSIIEFMCLKECLYIFVYETETDLVKEVCVANSQLVYSVVSKTLRNIDTTYLSTIIPNHDKTVTGEDP